MAAERDRYLDLVRGFSIVAVVVGHWLVADFWWDGALHQQSALGQVPQLWPLTWLFQVIPLFFCVAGSVNGRSWQRSQLRRTGYATFVDRRAHRVLVPTGVYLAVVFPVAVVADAQGGWGVRAGGAMMLQPLWFLAVYLVVVALTPLTWAAHDRFGWWVPASLLAAVVAVDVARIGFGMSWLGYLNVLTVWVLVYQLGYFESEHRLTRAVASAMVVGGLLATSLLVGLGPYPARMVGVRGDQIANMHPPTVALTGLAVAQVGLLVLARPWLAGWLRRPRVWAGVVWVNLSIMTLYLWHQVASITTARVLLAAGWPRLEPGTPGWWVWHAGRLAVASAVLLAIVALVGRFERVEPPARIRAGWRTAILAVVSVTAQVAGLLGLAGTRITEPLRGVDLLGVVTASPALAAVVLAVGAVGFWAQRRLFPATTGERYRAPVT